MMNTPYIEDNRYTILKIDFQSVQLLKVFYIPCEISVTRQFKPNKSVISTNVLLVSD